jgi:2',3'-cyclic-nucleotide 2'-phosphodiesterase (5'-nucleotidase family)
MRKLLILTILSLSLLDSYSKVTLKQYERMPVDKRYDSLPPTKLVQLMKPFREELSKIVDRPIGTSAQFMEAKAPESLLSNFLADQLLLKAAEYVPEGVDLAIINLGGIRAPLPAGPLTVGDIYRIMPFENEVVVLELKATDILAVLTKIAMDGGEGLSNVRILVEGGQLKSLMIAGKPFDETRTYRLATMDYLADGNSGMTPLKNAVKRIDTHVKMRDAYISRIEQITAQGKKVESALDGRLYYSFK